MGNLDSNEGSAQSLKSTQVKHPPGRLPHLPPSLQGSGDTGESETPLRHALGRGCCSGLQGVGHCHIRAAAERGFETPGIEWEPRMGVSERRTHGGG